MKKNKTCVLIDFFFHIPCGIIRFAEITPRKVSAVCGFKFTDKIVIETAYFPDGFVSGVFIIHGNAIFFFAVAKPDSDAAADEQSACCLPGVYRSEISRGRPRVMCVDIPYFLQPLQGGFSSCGCHQLFKASGYNLVNRILVLHRVSQ